jgi:NADH dehydrogenase
MARKWPGTRFYLSEVTGVDFDAREVRTDNGRIPYDYLVIGAGSITNYFGLESVERYAFYLKELADGETLRNHIHTAFERAVNEPDPARKRALMTFVIVGGGPTGVEFAGALIELVHFVLAKDYPELSIHAARVVLVEAGDPSVRAGLALSDWARQASPLPDHSRQRRHWNTPVHQRQAPHGTSLI